jgi:hypothetical protein
MDYIDSKSDDAPFYSRAYGAYKWLKNVVGLDLCRMERSWREFPVIAVPTQVSNYHGIEDPQSLFRYLDNVRLSCMAGAFLSAISMCRAATEILIRHHYNSKDDVTKLARLIKATEQKSEFRFIKRFNLLEKIDMANDILHFKKRDNYSETIAPVIISGWVKDLSEMIANAPRR